MKVVLGILFLVAVFPVLPTVAASHAMLCQEELRQWREQGKTLILVDVQSPDEYFEHHFEDSVPTEAYPVISEGDKAKLRPVLDSARSSSQPVVIVSTTGGDEAGRAGDFLLFHGVTATRLYILKGGVEGAAGKPVCDCCKPGGKEPAAPNAMNK